MNNYQVTIGYKAVITVNVKAEDESEAKEKALKIFDDKVRGKIRSPNINLEDDSYNAYGVLNMDGTWNTL